MFIHKFTHLESNRSYIGQTIQDPNRRRSKQQRSIKALGENNPLYGTTWKIVNGKRVYSRKI